MIGKRADLYFLYATSKASCLAAGVFWTFARRGLLARLRRDLVRVGPVVQWRGRVIRILGHVAAGRAVRKR
jgi:hypothetical protein